jgi:hypothetical protein
MSNETPQSQPDKFIVETLKSGGTKYSIKIGDWVIQFSHDKDETIGAVTLSKGSEIHWQSVWEVEDLEIERLRAENDMLKAKIGFLDELIDKDLTAAINAGDIPTPSKGQETKELKKKIETEINDLHEEFKNLPQEDQDKRKSWMAVRCDVLRQVLFWIASPPNSEQGAHECDASKCVEN